MRKSALVLAAMLAIAAGCGSSHPALKPKPVIYGSGKVDLCDLIPENSRTPDVKVFYATNRVPKGRVDDREYTNGVDDKLHVGVATVRMGGSKATWDDICKASRGGGGDPKFVLANASEMADRAAFYDAINEQLAVSPNHEVNVYIHGFKTYFEWEIELLAKLFHCSGRRGAMVLFCWPSRQSLMVYGGDVERGIKSAPLLADLIDDIAKNTKAEHINVLSYSCGAVVSAEALCELRKRHASENPEQLGKSLRIGNIIFAASDIDMMEFAKEQFTQLKEMARNVVIYISENDAALGMASFGTRASRLGRPDPGKFTKAELEQHIRDPQLQVIDVTDVPGPHAFGGGFGGHGYWYANDRIMTDLLVAFRWQISPDQRGLYRKPDRARWFFPKDYPEKVTAAVMQLAPKSNAPPVTTNSN